LPYQCMTLRGRCWRRWMWVPM